MKRNINLVAVAAIVLLVIAVAFNKKQTEPWRPDQLIEPEDLAPVINSSAEAKPLIISIGPAGLIKDAVTVGAVHEKENMDRLKEVLSKEQRDREIVIY